MRISDWSSDVCSSDLVVVGRSARGHGPVHLHRVVAARQRMKAFGNRGQHGIDRSEEHTSELQSLMRISYAVFCLKTKKKRNTQRNDKMQNTSNTTSTHNPTTK